jgi:pilus assembly protein CpaB
VARRIIAAVAALILAAVGVVLVLSYANRADERAIQDQATVDVLVTTESVPAGTAVEDMEGLVEEATVPQALVTAGTLTDLSSVEGLVVVSQVAAGEVLHEGRFLDPNDVRAAGVIALPDGTEEMHQVTVPLGKARALGGNIAPGDTVGIFMSFDATASGAFVMGPDGQIEQLDSEADSSSASISMTHLSLHKVPVVRVEGAYVPPPPMAQDDEDQAGSASAEDTIFVTLALEAPDAETLVFGMEWGEVWLSYEPEDADEDGTEVVVVTIPNEARDVFQ